MGKPRLNPFLLAKMAQKKRATAQRIREGISHRASRMRVAPEAAQLVWADEVGISIGGALGKLPAHIQQQVREHTRPATDRAAASTRSPIRVREARRTGDGTREAVNRIITDPDLVAGCSDILKGARRFDRAINQATLVLETRLRKIAGPRGAKVPAPALVGMVLHSPTPMLRLNDDNDVQDGYFSIVAGLFAVFRNLTHHKLAEFSREDAISICGFVNAVLDAMGKGKLAAAAPGAAAAPAPAPKSSPKKE